MRLGSTHLAKTVVGYVASAVLVGCGHPAAETIAKRATDLLQQSKSTELTVSTEALLRIENLACVILGENDRPVGQANLKEASREFLLGLRPDPIDVNIVAFSDEGRPQWHHRLHRQDRDLTVITYTREDSDVCLERNDSINIRKIDDGSIVIVIDDRG